MRAGGGGVGWPGGAVVAHLDKEHFLADVVLPHDVLEGHVELEDGDLDEEAEERLVGAVEERHALHQVLVQLQAHLHARAGREAGVREAG